MAGQFKTTAEEMNAFANRIGEVNAQVQGEIQRLNALVDSIKAGWQGQAAQAYQQMQTRFNEDATALNKVLDEIKQAIEATTKLYAQTEQEQQSSMSGLGH
ncbi:WXG100 family type VII secretion target [Kitasatospora sp. DSM 101779]|uniref:WXG100 family type VII secretion target n=1 Tax=unclassified Kitasatospora TaxID=2633591 RepID=UPI0021DA746D|nr:WXG100 family type VII secretion target [Kitasatospora sp. DSM 101779]MCU7824731.1 WXG100 family type VII secretion target [Kitasatospora sp. DSM 101779]